MMLWAITLSARIYGSVDRYFCPVIFYYYDSTLPFCWIGLMDDKLHLIINSLVELN